MSKNSKNWKIAGTVAAGVIALSATLATTVSATPAHPTTQAAATVADHHGPKPTVVLIHGAFADGSSWNSEVAELQHDGYSVIAPDLPLRGVASDSAYVTSIVRDISGPVVLVGHSYGGEIATEVAAGDPQQIKGIVYAAAYIPQAGETALGLTTQFPGSLLGPDTITTVNTPDGVDTYIKPSAFHALFAGDRTASQAAVGAATQRPITQSALTEPAAAGVPAGIPLYAIVASQDKAIPPAAEKFMAQRAGATIYTVNSAHDIPVSHPRAIVSVIERAAH
ncbi:MAG TPA: alpha/beta hydrolase [Pseudonocardiaceae bacterium]|nr:alpha/beta hydrolase [Pseudonocardiaceae bacterium]